MKSIWKPSVLWSLGTYHTPRAWLILPCFLPVCRSCFTYCRLQLIIWNTVCALRLGLGFIIAHMNVSHPQQVQETVSSCGLSVAPFSKSVSPGNWRLILDSWVGVWWFGIFCLFLLLLYGFCLLLLFLFWLLFVWFCWDEPLVYSYG